MKKETFMDKRSTLSPYYPTAQSLAPILRQPLAFVGCHWWWPDPPEKFRELRNQAYWVNKLETRENVIAEWRKHPDAIRLLEWAKQKGGGEIDPVIIGGTYGDYDEWGVPNSVQLMLYYPGHSRNTNEKYI